MSPLFYLGYVFYIHPFNIIIQHGFQLYKLYKVRPQISIGQNNIGQNNIGQNNIGQNNIGQNNIGQNNIGQSNIGQNNIGQNNIGQNNIGQNRKVYVHLTFLIRFKGTR